MRIIEKVWNVGFNGIGMDAISLTSEILHRRGIKNIDKFLNPSKEDIIPYNKFKNIDNAAQIVINGLKHNKKFKVFFDIDNDGISSGSIMYRYLLNFTNNLDWTINIGKKHGLQEEMMSNYIDTDILIIVDSLNSNMKLYRELIDRNIQIIVLDHHIPNREIDSKAINLVSSAVDYPNSQLSGSGVVWKFCMYLDTILNTKYASQYIDLAACGIISDMCDVSQNSLENRFICDQGFKRINNIGLKKINGNYAFDSTAVSFGVAPLINAACREFQNKDAARIFITDDVKQVRDNISKLKKCKEKQNFTIAHIMPNVIKQAQGQSNNKFLVVKISDNYELAGLLGNKLIAAYQRPVLVIHQDGEDWRGSGRGVGVKNFKAIVNKTGLCKSAGHENAFGIEISQSKFNEFIDKLSDILTPISFKSIINADVKLSPLDITGDTIHKMKSINRITGTGFEPISVMIDGIQGYKIFTMSNGKHLKIEYDDIDFIKWNFAGDIDTFNNILYNPILSFIGTLDENHFRGMTHKQMIVNDYKIKNGMESY